MKLGFIGLGNMAKAMIGGILKKEVVPATDIMGCAKSEASKEYASGNWGILIGEDNIQVAHFAEILVLAVKPQVLPRVVEQIKDAVSEGTVIVSIAAGVSMDSLGRMFGRSLKFVRCMPNTPALVGMGCTGVCCNELVTRDEMQQSLSLLQSFGLAEEVPEKLDFMATSCCPAWSVMAKKNFPKFADCISMAMTPMVLTARLLKQDHPAARICFVGPCAAKKLEASRHSVRSEVDFVLTFEELMGMFEAKQINFDDLPDDPNDNFNNASADGRGFAVSGGVAQAVVNVIKKEDPTREVKVVSAQGLAECKKMMQLAAAGKYNGYLLEGMACPGGCIAGAGTLADPARSAMMLNKYKAQATMKTAADTPYKDTLDKLKY